LFESSAKVEAAGVARARRFWGKFNSNFNLEELGSFFLGFAILTSRKALLVNVSLSNHCGLSALVGMSSILETMIPSFASLTSSSISASFTSECASSAISDGSCPNTSVSLSS
jgi:hypothetical protein